MHVVRFDEAPSYDAPGHALMQMVRLQGREAGPADTVWLGVSTIAPGGGTTLDGTVTVSNGQDKVSLHRWDSCRIAPGEGRQISNDTDKEASILLVMPLPPVSA